MALHLLVLLEREQVDKRHEEAAVDDGRFVGGVDRDVADAGGGWEDEGEVGGVEQAEEGFEAVGFDDFELVFFCALALYRVCCGGMARTATNHH
jgi:hypothetical protein